MTVWNDTASNRPPGAGVRVHIEETALTVFDGQAVLVTTPTRHHQRQPIPGQAQDPTGRSGDD